MSTAIESTTASSTVDNPPRLTLAEPSERGSRRWMVALDDSIESEWAFWSAVGNMDKERDSLHLIAVTNKKLNHEDISRTVLLPFTEKAQNVKVRHIAMILGISTDVRSQLKRASVEYKIDTLVVGHRKGLSWQSRFLSGNPSVAKECITAAECQTLVVSQPPAGWTAEESSEEKPPRESSPEKTSKKAKKSEDKSKKHDEIREAIAKHLIVGGKEYLVEVMVDK